MIWFNGRFKDDETALIRGDNRGLLLGDGLFDTLHMSDGTLHYFERHWARLTSGLRAAGLSVEYTPPEIERAIHELAEHHQLMRAAIRISVASLGGGRGLDRPAPHGCAWIIQAHPYYDQTDPLSAAIAPIRRHSSAFSSRMKTLSYMDNVMARRQVDADEALLLNEFDRLSCAAAGNVFIVRDRTVLTPPLSEGVLNGIIRTVMLEHHQIAGYRIQEALVERHHIQDASHIFITNSLIGARAVHHLTFETGETMTKDTKSCTPLIEAIREIARA